VFPPRSPLSLYPLRSAGAILCFHSVTAPGLSAQGIVHVPVEGFKSLLAAATRVGRLVPLRDLVRRHLAGRNTDGLISVTVDDAYASLLGEVADFVYREAIPVTVFAVSHAAALGSPYWWDRIDDVFPRVPIQRWRAFEDGSGLPAEYRNGQPAHYGPLRPFRQWLLAAHAGRWPPELEPLLRGLEEEAGTHTVQRSMTFEELARFAALPSVDVGVHTLSHPVLPLLPDVELHREIAASYEALRARFVNAVPILAVPFGLFDGRTLVAAREAGMTASLTLAGTTLKRRRGRDELPRFCVSRDDSALKLQLRLAGVSDWVRRWREGAAPPYPELPSPTT
jgi:peptidoglycan/xylan/chitin deacetylase (PgdA/CDA1 family)